MCFIENSATLNIHDTRTLRNCLVKRATFSSQPLLKPEFNTIISETNVPLKIGGRKSESFYLKKRAKLPRLPKTICLGFTSEQVCSTGWAEEYFRGVGYAARSSSDSRQVGLVAIGVISLPLRYSDFR